MGEADLLIVAGEVTPAVASAFPGMGLAWCACVVPADPLGRSSAALRARLRGLADRLHAAEAAELRSRPIPNAYRMLFRRLGVDPDVSRVPVEAFIVERLTRGGYKSRGVLPDALLIATVETGVGVWACAGPGPVGLDFRDGQVVVTGPEGVVAPVFESPSVPAAARSLVLYAVVAPGVPAIAVSEALWTAWDVLLTA